MGHRRDSRAHPAPSIRHSRRSSSGSEYSSGSVSSGSSYSGRSGRSSYSSGSGSDASSAMSRSSVEDQLGPRTPFYNPLSEKRIDIKALRESIFRLPTELNTDPRGALERAVLLCRDLTIAGAAGRRSGMDGRVESVQAGQAPLQNIGKRFFLPDQALLKDMLPGSIVEVYVAAPLQHPMLKPMTGGPEKVVWSLVDRGHERIGRNADGRLFRV